MKRVLLKLSGEALAGDKHTGFDEPTVTEVAKQVKQIVDGGTEVGIVIGDTTRLSERFQERIRELEAASAKNDGLNLQIAINYGSRDEMTRAMRRMSEDVAAGKRKPEEITESVFEEYLDTAGIPDPDLLIRTSGELRLSNFLLWQLAYSEFYFTDVPWPDFHKEELERAIEAYNKRDRRFGGLTDNK